MGRKRSDRPGRSVTLWLPGWLVERLGDNPKARIFDLINQSYSPGPFDDLPGEKLPGPSKTQVRSGRWSCPCGQTNFGDECFKCKRARP